MKVIIEIEGRKAIPVRALPWITEWHFDAYAVAEVLAGHNPDWEAVKSHYESEGKVEQAGRGLWERVIQAIEEIEEKGLSRQRYEAEVTEAMPAGVWVWVDEWESAYNASPDGPKNLEPDPQLPPAARVVHADDANDMELRRIRWEPHVPGEIRAELFSGLPHSKPPAQPWAGRNTELFPGPEHVPAAEPTPEPPPTSPISIDPDGVPTSGIAAAFDGLKWSAARWREELGDPPKWLEAARITRGLRGKREGGQRLESTWNPVIIGDTLKGFGIPIGKISRAFKQSPELEPWRDRWIEWVTTHYFDSD